MNWKVLVVLVVVLAMVTGCGESQPETAGDAGGEGRTVTPSGDEPAAAAGGTDGVTCDTKDQDEGYSVEDELVCRANMESLAMLIMNDSQMLGSCPATLEEFQGQHPAHAAMEIECCGVDYIYETDGPDFTIRCPNGHGEVVNGEISWTW